MNQRTTVLIVDDEPLNQETVVALLSPLGYQLICAGSGTEALRLARATPPDVILLDVMMPGMDGFEVCRRLRADAGLREVPVIMLTALDDRESRLRGIEAGADDFVSKPYDRIELRARVRTIARLNRYQRLVGERAKFAWVVDQAEDGYLVLGADGAISYANPRARFYLGAPPEGEIETSFLDLAARQYHLEPASSWEAWFGQPNAQREAARLLVRPASQNAEIFLLQVSLLDMPADPEPGCLVRLRDITATVVSQHTVWSFQALIRHKLSTALAQLIGGMRLIDGMALAPAEGTLAEILGIMSKGANRLQADITDIFQYIDVPDLVRSERGSCSPAELPAIIAEVAEQCQVGAPSVQNDMQLAPGARDLAISRRGLQLIIGELIENARKFHPRQEPAIEITIARDSDAIVLHIRDNGVALAPDQLERVWLPYYQSERFFTGQMAGMGLGLPMVASLLWRIGGACRLSNRVPGPGIDAEVRIPLVERV